MNAAGGALNERTLGKKLQAARQQAGLTQQALCHRANLSYSTLAKIERGAIKSPSIFTIQSIAEALNVGLDNLLELPTMATASRRLQKTQSGIGFIYFDVNGCLVRSYQQAFSRLAQISAVPADIIESTFWHYNDEVCRGIMSLSDFNAILAERLSLDSVEWQTYYLQAIEPVKQMHELALWASQHYRVGILSNIMPGLITAMRHNGLLPPISYDAVVDSSEVGTVKPEAQIYQIATERAACPASEILLIDDTRGNLPPAERAGWHVLWFDYAQPDEAVAHIRKALEPAS